jgi:hypothetical protein
VFDVEEFVGRIYNRRNKSSHGGPHLDREPPDALMRDTWLLAAIYLIIECSNLGLDARAALRKLKGALYIDLPLRASD